MKHPKQAVKAWGVLVKGKLVPFADGRRNEAEGAILWKDSKTVRVEIVYVPPKRKGKL